MSADNQGPITVDDIDFDEMKRQHDEAKKEQLKQQAWKNRKQILIALAAIAVIIVGFVVFSNLGKQEGTTTDSTAPANETQAPANEAAGTNSGSSSSQSQASSQSSKSGSEVTIKVEGADGSTRTATIHRSGSSERVFPDSNTRRLSEKEVSALSDAERCIAWNEIIAASNGYSFKNGGLSEYFDNCSWYHRDSSASGAGNLSAEATANIDLLKSKTDEWWFHLATH